MTDSASHVSAADRAALLRKYDLLARWRRAKDRSFEPTDLAGSTPAPPGDALADRDAMRALAAEFPGALRELDRLGARELERRVTVLSRNAGGVLDEPGVYGSGTDGEPEEPWIAWILAYHDLLRRALESKRAGTALPSPAGRASVGVLRALGTRFGVPPDEIAAALFPPRRRPSSR